MIQSQYDRGLGNETHKACSQTSKISSSRQPTYLPSNVKGKDLFDSVLWKDPLSISIFYKFTASLRRKIHEQVKQTTPTHRFIRTLRDSRKLVRCYTQNIDGLESREGLCIDLSKGKGNRARFTKKVMEKQKAPTGSTKGNQDGGCEVVQLHGDLDTLRCNICQKTCGWEGKGREALLLDGKAPECLSCSISDQDRRDRGKRGIKVGTLRPNIVLYGEEHPSADILGTITTHDLGLAPDVLLILGTSLHVHGLKILVKEFAKCVRARSGGNGKIIFVNLSKPSESIWKDAIDYWVSMDCDEWIGALRRHRPDLWQIQKQLKLNVKKQDSEKPHEAIIYKQHMAYTEDKENMDEALQDNPRPKFARTASQRKREKFLVDPGSKTPRNGSPVAWDTESARAISRTTESEQLPTPPPSGHRAQFQAAGKRPLSLDGQSGSPQTPSKRARSSLKIWEDEDSTPERATQAGCPERQKIANGQRSLARQTTGRIHRAWPMVRTLGSFR